MIKKNLFLHIFAAIILVGCWKNEEKPSENLNNATSVSQEKQVVQEKQVTATPHGDKSFPLEKYQELTSGKQLLYAYLAASNMPIDFDKVASYISKEYKFERNEFKKRDLLDALKPAILKEVEKAKQNQYYYIVIDDHPIIDKYDFSNQAFSIIPLRDSKSYRYFYDVSEYKLGFSNSSAFNSLKITDEDVARNIESLRSQYKTMRLIVYFFANDTELGENKIKGEIMHIKLVDNNGSVLAEQ